MENKELELELEGSTGGRGGDTKTIIAPNTSYGDIINILKYIIATFIEL